MTRAALRGLVLVSSFLAMACATSPKLQSEREPEDNIEGLPAPTPGAIHELPKFTVKNPEPTTVAEKSPELDEIPMEINAKVEQWINYFQGRGRPHMERYLSRSTRYTPVMQKILRQNGLPEDLIYIALIESGFSANVASRAAAVGFWQFIRGTGRRYGLEISPLVDERRDPVLSTQAAAEYFKGLYSVFGSWYLAMASYNVGENRVQREVMKHHTRDFWELVHKRRLPKETMNYVPKFLAAKLIGQNPEKYGFTEIDYDEPLEFETISVENSVNLRLMAEKMNMEYDDLKQLNPKFRGEIAPTKSSGVLELRVPVGQALTASTAAKTSIVDKLEFIADAGETESYKIRSGDSLYSVARKYKTTVAWIRDTNDLKAGRKLKIGMRIQVPDRSASKPVKRVSVAVRERPQIKEDSAPAAQSVEIVTNKGVLYVVQPGDSLYSIAEEYDSSIKELLRMNKMRRGQVLKAGMKIQVPKEEALPEELGDDSKNQKANGESKGLPGTSLRRSPGQRRDLVAQKWFGPRSVAANTKATAKAKIYHVVKRGENLTQIATKYKLPLESLLAQNRLNKKNLDVVFVGKRLEIPNSRVVLR
jgi:membrane-bound lytic murein transglycosylase D